MDGQWHRDDVAPGEPVPGGTGHDQPGSQSEATVAELGDRLRGVEQAVQDLEVGVEAHMSQSLSGLESRLDDLVASLERHATESVATEISMLVTQLRKAVGELGRMLVQDRGHISQVLSEHRDVILAELRRSQERASEPAQEDDAGEADGAPEPEEDAAQEVAQEVAQEAAQEAAGGHRFGLRRRGD
jgi:hypothetical protein